MARLPFLISCLFVLVGLYLIVSRFVYLRREKRKVRAGAGPEFVPLLPAFWVGSTILGSVLAAAGVGGAVADHYGVFGISQKQDVLVGTIANAQSSQIARVKPDRGQTESPTRQDEFVTLQKAPIDQDKPNVDTAYEFFRDKNGQHCVLHGEWISVPSPKQFWVKTSECNQQ
jgi:hypothetical protein